MTQSEGQASDRREATVLSVPRLHQGIVIGIAVAVGLVLGWLAPRIIGLALSVEWLPFQGPMRLLERAADSWGAWVLILLGGVVGVLAGLYLLSELVPITITDRELLIGQGAKKKRYARSQVSLVEFDEGRLVLRDRDDVDLTRVKVDASAREVTAALRQHRWPVEDR